MAHQRLNVEVESRCISVWKEPWARRSARVTLLVDLDDRFVIVMGTSNGFWFLPGGGIEQNESMEETARREASEELGLEVKIDRTIKIFHVTLVSKETGEQLEIPPFIAVHALPVTGRLKTEYSAKRKILLVRRNECESLLQKSEVPPEYECLKPYLYTSKETISEFLGH